MQEKKKIVRLSSLPNSLGFGKDHSSSIFSHGMPLLLALATSEQLSENTSFSAVSDVHEQVVRWIIVIPSYSWFYFLCILFIELRWRVLSSLWSSSLLDSVISLKPVVLRCPLIFNTCDVTSAALCFSHMESKRLTDMHVEKSWLYSIVAEWNLEWNSIPIVFLSISAFEMIVAPQSLMKMQVRWCEMMHCVGIFFFRSIFVVL